MRGAVVLTLGMLMALGAVRPVAAGGQSSLTQNAGPPAPLPAQPSAPGMDAFQPRPSIFPPPRSIFPSPRPAIPPPAAPSFPPFFVLPETTYYAAPGISAPSCASAGYWSYIWVAQPYPSSEWVPGHFTDDGFWVDGRYEAPVIASGYWQPYWVSMAPGC